MNTQSTVDVAPLTTSKHASRAKQADVEYHIVNVRFQCAGKNEIMRLSGCTALHTAVVVGPSLSCCHVVMICGLVDGMVGSALAGYIP